MTPPQMIEDCKRSGVLLQLTGGALKLKGAPEAVQVAALKLRPHKAKLVNYLKVHNESRLPHDSAIPADILALFRFDLVQRDIEEGYPTEELHRVNNMAWEFMRVDGMGFDAAIRAAAEIVAHAQIAACEAAYADVMELFKKVSL